MQPTKDESAGMTARVGLAFGVLAMIVLPIAYGWAFRPATRPAGAEVLIPLVEAAGLVAALAAVFLGRRARAAGDRTGAAVWAPRLGAAAIVGFAATLAWTMSGS